MPTHLVKMHYIRFCLTCFQLLLYGIMLSWRQVSQFTYSFLSFNPWNDYKTLDHQNSHSQYLPLLLPNGTSLLICCLKDYFHMRIFQQRISWTPLYCKSTSQSYLRTHTALTLTLHSNYLPTLLSPCLYLYRRSCDPIKWRTLIRT
jgi:hypothetical protein